MDFVKGAILADRRNFIYAANFKGIDLRYARATGAFFVKAQMPGADLRNAELTGADFRKSNLSRSDLRGVGVVLEGVDLRGANLREADLTNASFGPTVVKYADFRSAKGLTEAVRYACSDYVLAFFDPDMLKQLGLPPDHNEKLQQQMKAEQQTKAAATAPPSKVKP